MGRLAVVGRGGRVSVYSGRLVRVVPNPSRQSSPLRKGRGGTGQVQAVNCLRFESTDPDASVRHIFRKLQLMLPSN